MIAQEAAGVWTCGPGFSARPLADCCARTLGYMLAVVLVGAAAAPQQRRPEHHIDVGTLDDEQFVGPGIYQREGPNERSKHPFYRECSMRWFSNSWVLALPVFARRDNEVTLRAKFARGFRLSLGQEWELLLKGVGDEGYEYRFAIPRDAVGDRESIEINGAAQPPFAVPEGGRDTRELAMAVDWIRIRPAEQLSDDVPVFARRSVVGEEAEQHFINIGLEGDERVVVSGIYGREGPHAWSRDPMARWYSFRWFSSEWALKLPAFPHRHNEITVRGKSSRAIRLSADGGFEAFLFGSGRQHVHRILVPAQKVGPRRALELRGKAMSAQRPAEGARDQRDLAMMVDWIRVRPLAELPEDIMDSQQLPTEREPDLPLPFRLRGTESRPLYTDVASYVLQARLMRCNVMTIGPMNGQHFAAFPTEYGTPHPRMQPDFIPSQISALHDRGIAAIGWLPFNVQDLRSADQCQAAKEHPEWRMEYIEWPERPATNRVGMCVISSPWRQMHAEILKEAAGLGLDGVFFDGFYLGGIPHPTSPGCVCRYCRQAFRDETGLDVPPRVDWTNPTFKRWVRWRNSKLLEVARYFRDKMREVNPGLQVTCNYNVWPFGNKDWDTAIPLWSTDQFGVSQHAYSGRNDLQWVMLGFKARLSHDLNPRHSDIWRTSRPTWQYDDSEADRTRHELTMRTFMLAGLTYGTTPWHGGHIQPPEIGVRVHKAVKQRERFFSHDELRHVGVALSQNTHDFYGHIPGTTNLADYRDTILGVWLLLTEDHIPFRFVFDDQLEAGQLRDCRVLVLPNTACLSDGMVGQLRRYIDEGGRLVTTGETGAYDEWGERRQAKALDGMDDLVGIAGQPALAWLRSRDEGAAESLLDAIAATPAPLRVEAPRWLVANPFWAPDRKAIWLHMLNVSAFYPLGDTGFRGMEQEPVYSGQAATEAPMVEGGKLKPVSVPVRNVVVSVPELRVRRAWLGAAGDTIEPEAEGRYLIPEIEAHDVLILELE